MKMFGLAKLKNYASVAGVALLLPFGSATAFANPNPATVQVDTGMYQVTPERVEWTEEKRKKLRHAYWLLEQADRDYGGHKGEAMKHIKEAGKIMGMDLKGDGYGGKKQRWSDALLKEARDTIYDLAERSGGPKEHEQLRLAIKELDKALEVH